MISSLINIYLNATEEGGRTTHPGRAECLAIKSLVACTAFSKSTIINNN